MVGLLSFFVRSLKTAHLAQANGAALLIVFVGCVANADDALTASSTTDVHQMRPPVSGQELQTRARASIERGYDYIAGTQNVDGSWGSHDPQIAMLANFGFQLRNRGAQDAVRTACSAICAKAILRKKNRHETDERVLKQAIKELARPCKFAYQPKESFNTWGYGYKLEFLTELYRSPEAAEHKQAIRKGAQSCVDGLLKYQQHDGGWGYYAGVQKDFDTTSFNTAFFALALHRAAGMKLQLPQGMINDAATIVDKQRVPDGSFVYSAGLRTNGGSILKNLGAGSRTAAATLALFEIGRYDKDDLRTAIKIFDDGENYLESGRKLITPHSAVHQISGYFFFFGYNYITEVAQLLADEVPTERWERFAWTMIRTQEDDGRWWDTACADYGDKWGTGFAVLSLQRYLDEMERRHTATEPEANTDPKVSEQSQANEAAAASDQQNSGEVINVSEDTKEEQ